MIKNPEYVYGGDDVTLPHHLNVGQHMVDTMKGFGDKVALINGKSGKKFTYKELVEDTMHLSLSLRDLGIRKGDTVAICSENRLEFWSSVFGIACTGATVVAVNFKYTTDELKHVLGISKPNVIICSPISYKLQKETLRYLPYLKIIIIYGKDRQPNTILYEDLVRPKVIITVEDFRAVDVQGHTDTLFLLYTSGTTGLPKGVMLTHSNVLTVCSFSSTLDPEKMTFNITPWSNSMGLMSVLKSFIHGMTSVYLLKYNADFYLKTMEKYKVAQLMVASPVLAVVSECPAVYDVSSVTLAYSGGAPLRNDTIQKVQKKIPNARAIIQSYGMTETIVGFTRDTHDKIHLAKPGGVGYIAKCTTVKIEDIETRKLLGPNELGEICVKGSTVMKGYVGRNNADFFDDEGFFRTGDIGYYDEDKYFFIVDRLEDLIKYKGYQVAPSEIEGVLLQHPGIRDAGVIGVPHPTGEVPKAFVVLQPGGRLSEKEIQAYVAEKFPDPKHLRGGVTFVKEIPKNACGKILRIKLQEMTKHRSKL